MLQGDIMKKIFLILICLMFFVNSSYAQKSEWLDPTYDFTKVKRICIDFDVKPELRDGIKEKESQEIFYEAIKETFVDVISKPKYQVDSIFSAQDKFLMSGKTSKEERDNLSNDERTYLLNEYLKTNYDVIVKCTVLQFDNGKKYRGGFFVGSVFVPGGDENAIFINAHFNVIDTKTKQNVWSVEDKRDKEGTTKKKGMFKRIIADFSSSFINVLQTKKPTAKSVKKVGF